MKIFVKICTAVVIVSGLLMLSACEKDAGTQKAGIAVKYGAVQKLPKLIDLGAHKCIPCKKMAPILDELARDYTGVFDVEFIDVWQPENKEKAQAYGIESIPTQIFFDAEGKELWRHVGFISKEDLLNKWKELGYDMKIASGSGTGT